MRVRAYETLHIKFFLFLKLKKKKGVLAIDTYRFGEQLEHS